MVIPTGLCTGWTDTTQSSKTPPPGFPFPGCGCWEEKPDLSHTLSSLPHLGDRCILKSLVTKIRKEKQHTTTTKYPHTQNIKNNRLCSLYPCSLKYSKRYFSSFSDSFSSLESCGNLISAQVFSPVLPVQWLYYAQIVSGRNKGDIPGVSAESQAHSSRATKTSRLLCLLYPQSVPSFKSPLLAMASPHHARTSPSHFPFISFLQLPPIFSCHVLPMLPFIIS